MNIVKSETPKKARVIFEKPSELQHFAAKMPFFSVEYQRALSGSVPPEDWQKLWPMLPFKPFSLQPEDYPQETTVSIRNLGKVAAALTELADAPDLGREYVQFGLGIARTIHEFMLTQVDNDILCETPKPVA